MQHGSPERHTDGEINLEEKKVRTDLKIDGMTCEMCVQHVTRALRSTPGVSAAQVDLQNKSAVVEGENYDVNQLLDAVAEEGYEAREA
jgi:Au+-exporting ATPase